MLYIALYPCCLRMWVVYKFMTNLCCQGYRVGFKTDIHIHRCIEMSLIYYRSKCVLGYFRPSIRLIRQSGSGHLSTYFNICLAHTLWSSIWQDVFLCDWLKRLHHDNEWIVKTKHNILFLDYWYMLWSRTLQLVLVNASF